MAKPLNKEEYRKLLAEQSAHVLGEKGFDRRKEWNAGAGTRPHNGVTGNVYKNCNVNLTNMIIYARTSTCIEGFMFSNLAKYKDLDFITIKVSSRLLQKMKSDSMKFSQ